MRLHHIRDMTFGMIPSWLLSLIVNFKKDYHRISIDKKKKIIGWIKVYALNIKI